jgi:SAM-dependent methyltransferase
MTVSGRLQLSIWRLRLQLRKSSLLRSLVKLLRRAAPDTRDRHLRMEVAFWRRWLATEGLNWPEDYAMRFDPDAPVQEHLARVIDRLPGSVVQILDVGAGPVTVLGKTHPTKQLSITATDVLAREYNGLLADFDVKPLVRTQFAESEMLRHRLGDRQFDIVHAQNTLDHSANPFAALEEMLGLTKPEGFVVLLHEENEGKNELYHALHKWDFACEGGRFLISGPGPNGPRRDIAELMAGRAELECSIHHDEVLVVMRKLPEPIAVRRAEAASLAEPSPAP